MVSTGFVYLASMSKSDQPVPVSLATSWLSGQGNKNTASAYRVDLQLYEDWLTADGLTVATVTTRDLERFIQSRRMVGASVSSLNRIIAAVKSFHRHLTTAGHVERDPARGLARVPVQDKAPNVVSVAQMLQILDSAHERALETIHPKHKSAALARAAAMIETAYSSGFEVSSLVALPISVVHSGPMIQVTEADGSVRDRIINARARQAIDLWRARAEECSEEVADQWLFHATRSPGQQMARAQANRDFEDAGRTSGLSLPFIFSPTVVRDSLAVHLLQNGMPAEECAYLLGHKDLASLDRLRVHVER